MNIEARLYYIISYIIRLRPLLFCRTIDRAYFILNHPIYTSPSITKRKNYSVNERKNDKRCKKSIAVFVNKGLNYELYSSAMHPEMTLLGCNDYPYPTLFNIIILSTDIVLGFNVVSTCLNCNLYCLM